MIKSIFIVRETKSYMPLRTVDKKLTVIGPSFGKSYDLLLMMGYKICCAWPDWPNEKV